MTAQHTQGRLTLGKWASASGGPEIKYVNGSAAEQVFHCQPMASADHLANARRLVACWNACAGFDTDLLENIDLMGDTLKQRFNGMQAEVRRADADTRAIEVNFEAARALLADVAAENSPNLMERIRAFLKGGA